MNRRRRELGEVIWAPLADTMTLVTSVFLVAFIVSLLAYDKASKNAAKANEEALTFKKLAVQKTSAADRAAEVMARAMRAATAFGPGEVERTTDRRVFKLKEGILFAKDSAEVLAGGRLVIKDVVAPAIASALALKGVRVVVAGHTDRTQCSADPFCNWRLSAQRATSVLAEILKSRPDIDPKQIVALGYADTRWLEGRSDEANRRVEIRIEPDVDDLFSSSEAGDRP